ncbi:MauE/DoxX family redox-associated membrane protein [Catenovulum sediminis]|uniref:MauE/DoxX family redox-associated membrane protein n=1 Tax=Catenovulum sediminis TaxID=1740262 RepID=UPI00117D1D5C|nr:MauE/DoxX family redox-associated membrane protein [Catenovulum sediminis]
MATEITIYRKRMCPYGQRAADLLRKQKLDFQDHLFEDKDEEIEFKETHKVKTTPQIFIGNKRIGGYQELAEYFNVLPKQSSKLNPYLPVIAIFSITLLMAIATETALRGFMGYSLCVLACLKLMDIQAFVEGFKQYDLLAKPVPIYAKIYPFAELAVGLGLLAKILPIAVAFIAIFIGTVGGISIIKAVYIDKKDLNCACVGGNSNVPLGFVSFTENLMMLLMGLVLII